MALKLEEIQNALTDLPPAKWHQLGLKLGVTPNTLSNIEYNHPRDVQRCLFEVLFWWHRNENSCDKLAQALEEMEYRGLADKLREKSTTQPPSS